MLLETSYISLNIKAIYDSKELVRVVKIVATEQLGKKYTFLITKQKKKGSIKSPQIDSRWNLP